MSHTLHPPTAIQLPGLVTHHSRKVVYAVFVLLASGTSIGIITAVAHWSGSPLVVPSLGPTAFLVFNRSQSSVAQPRNIICGHLIGAAAGYLSLLAFGLIHVPSVVAGGLTTSRIGAAALSIGLTSAAMILVGTEHGPAGATTLIVSLGFVRSLGSLGLLMAGVASLAGMGVLIDRLVGLRLPCWSGRHERPRPQSRSELPQWMLGPGDGRQDRAGAATCTVKVEDAHAGGPYALLDVALSPETATPMMHTHYDFTESYFVLDGEVSVDVDGTRCTAPPARQSPSPPARPIPWRPPVAVRHATSASPTGPASRWRSTCPKDRDGARTRCPACPRCRPGRPDPRRRSPP